MSFTKRIVPRILLLAILLLALTALCSCAKEQESAPPDDAFEMLPVLPGGYPVLFGGEETRAVVRLFGTRPYIGNTSVSHVLGKKIAATDSLTVPAVEFGGEEYISLADAARIYGLEVLFTDEETVCIWERKASQPWPAAKESAQAAKPCYVRLEDVTADEGISGRFTHANLQKLRVMALYLDTATDGFYIAWIPLYVNPGLSVQNDVSKDETFYNADFVYTLDYLIDHGGRIGLHGLSHQRDDEISADGYEFGERCDLTEEQVRQKYTDAIGIAERLGYTYTFWEFPHYEATGQEADIAAEYFDMIYQCHPDHKNDKVLDWRTYGERQVAFLPTPADYVHSEHDKAGVLERFAKLSENAVRSFYMHPSMDYRHISVRLDGKSAEPYYDAGGILPTVIAQLAQEGYRFQTVKP